MNELVDVRKLPNYLRLLNECEEIRDTTAKQALWLTILARFRLGRTILKYEEQGLIERKYGEAVIQALAHDLGFRHPAVVYRSVSCAMYFKTEQALKEFAHEYERTHEGKALTWTEIRDKILPQPKDDPDNHGGIEQVAQHVMSLTEKLGHELEDLKSLEQKVSPETKEQIAGVIHKVQEVINEPTFLPAAKVDRNTEYIEYIRTLRCIVCGKAAEPHHVEGGGVALKGSDYLTIPLCRMHHGEYHNMGRVAFEKANVCDVYYETTMCLAGFISFLVMGLL